MPNFHEYRQNHALNKNEIQEKWHFKELKSKLQII